MKLGVKWFLDKARILGKRDIMPRKGRNFELLTQALEKYAAEEGVTVESPGYVEDRITGKMREIDVLITRGEGHHKQLIAIECKDRKTPVGVPDVEAFHAKIQDLKITKAVFVSSSNFRKTAVTKAQFYNISCLDIDEINEFEWLLADCIHYHEKKLLKTHWIISANNKELEVAAHLVVKNKAGEELTDEILIENSRRVFNDLDLSRDLCINQPKLYQS
jgi:predicted helicase